MGGDEVAANRKETRPQESRTERDESVSGSESEASIASGEGSRTASSDEDETTGERRLRLAQQYLDNIREEVDEAGFDAADVDRDLIAQRLKEDADEAKGRQYRLIASTLNFRSATHCSFRADTLSTTAVAVCAPYVYTVSKDKTLIKWEIPAPASFPPKNGTSRKPPPPRRKKPTQLIYVRGMKINKTSQQKHGHTGPILSLAVSSNGQYVATGGTDKRLIIWCAASLQPLKTFTTHRDSITSLSFAPTSSRVGMGSQLFSSSADRTLKTYSLASDESLAYVETLFGHQDHVLAVAAMGQDVCVSVGARDRTARLWKVVDEAQLVFRGESSKNDTYANGSIDCVATIPPAHFVTGSDSGSLSLWSMHKKKPLHNIQIAHGVDEPPPMEQVTSEIDQGVIERLKLADLRKPVPRYITALTSVPGTDIVLSGSWDGWIRAWKVSDDKRVLIPLGVVGSADLSPSTETRHTPRLSGSIPAAEDSAAHAPPQEPQGPIRGVINSLAVFERRKRTVDEFGTREREGESLGFCIVAGTGKEMRLGRWKRFEGGRNGAVVFEVGVKGKDGRGEVGDVSLGLTGRREPG